MKDVTKLKTNSLSKTITFDPNIYKLVPIKLSDDMRLSIEGVNNSMEIAEYEAMYKCMLAAVPDQLPGVVVHSGEPAAYAIAVNKADMGAVFLNKQDCEMELIVRNRNHPEPSRHMVPLFTHPAPSQPSAEALVAAALEAALDAVQNVELNCETSGAAIKSAERLIRALDKQQIIESCK